MESRRHVEPMSFDLASPLVAGDEWVHLRPAQLPDGGMPLSRGQFISIGGELRIILEVGERLIRVPELEEPHARDEYVWRPAQTRQGLDDWFRLIE